MSENRIPILDLKPEIDTLWDEFNAAFQRVLRDGHFIMGADVPAFEREIATYLGVRHTIAMNSGTDALVIGLRALGVGPGDEVITTPFTFVATAEAATNLGATPMFVDIDPHTYNLDTALLEAVITPRTKAIIPVHLYGHAAEMDAVMAVADKYGLKVLEDVAQAFSGEHRGRKLGAIGHAGAFSFFPSKNLGAFGDGGLLATNDDAVAEAARMLRVHGAKRKYYNEVPGYSSRLDTLQAAMLRVKLPHVEAASAGRRAAAATYAELLRDIPDITLPREEDYARHVYHQYTVRVSGGKRDAVQERLDAAGIGTMIYYPVPLHRLPVYAHRSTPLPCSEQAAAEVLSLPIWPQITADVQARVADALRAVLS
jgi:dTDP-4-amino-4,6-dideoxygalactose transaminase